MEELPSKVDVVILGTGLPESVLAAACARSGLNVLHLDRNDYYGGSWSSFNLKTIDEWEESVSSWKEPEPTDLSSFVKDEEVAIRLGYRQTIGSLKRSWNQESGKETTIKNRDESETTLTFKEHLEKEWRRFSLDLAPKVLLSRGDMVTTLCDSEVSKYAEFKLVDRLLASEVESDRLSFWDVPYTRSQICTTSKLGPIEKRIFMKFLTFCVKWHGDPECEEVKSWKEFREKPFEQFLSTLQLKGRLLRMVTDCIGILHANSNAEQGLQAVCKFIDSCAVFGPSPFLFSMYGCGELPQCFCRLCAVYGGTYCLSRPIEGLIKNKDDTIVAVIAAGQRIECDHIVMSQEYIPEEFLGDNKSTVHRAFYLTAKSVLVGEKEHVSVANLPSIGNNNAGIRLLEVGWEVCSAPKGYFVVHLTSQQPIADEDVESQLFSKEEGFQPLHTTSFTSTSTSSVNLPSNVAVVSGPDHTPDYASVISETREIFKKFWSDRDFLPRKLHREEEETQGQDFQADEEREETETTGQL